MTLHGVFMEIYSIGVLITGESGSGKSELALELVTRGHRLVADDAPEFTQIAPDVLDGTCPDLLQDLLEVRGLGVLNMRQMFGDTAVKKNKYLRLIVHLTKPHLEPQPDGHRAPHRRPRRAPRARPRRAADHPARHARPQPRGADRSRRRARTSCARRASIPAAAFMARHSPLPRTRQLTREHATDRPRAPPAPPCRR